MGVHIVQVKFGISIAMFNQSKICWALDFSVPRDGSGDSWPYLEHSRLLNSRWMEIFGPFIYYRSTSLSLEWKHSHTFMVNIVGCVNIVLSGG